MKVNKKKSVGGVVLMGCRGIVGALWGNWEP